MSLRAFQQAPNIDYQPVTADQLAQQLHLIQLSSRFNFGGLPANSVWNPGKPANQSSPIERSFILGEDAPGIGQQGQRVLMAVAPADVTNQSEELDTYLGGYKPFGFGADLVSPIILVDKEAGTRRDLALANLFEAVNPTTGRTGAIKEIDIKSGTSSYRVQDFALASFLPWQTENDAAVLYNIRAAIGVLLQTKLALWREIKVWAQLTTTANWNANNTTTLSGGTLKWDNGSAKNPRADIQARLKATAQMVTGIWMNPDVAYWLLSDAGVIAYMRQMLGDNAPGADVAAAAQAGETGIITFRVPGWPPINILPAKQLNLSTGNLDYILADDVVFVSNPPGQPRDGTSILSHATYRTKGRSGVGTQTNEYIPQGRGLQSGTMFEVGYAEDTFFVSNQVGGLIKDVLST